MSTFDRKHREQAWWGGFTLQEAIFIGFCALLIVLSKIVFRFQLGITGHTVFFLAFFMLLCRGCVPRRWTATLVGLLAGCAAALLGFGRGGVLEVLKYLVPGLFIDLLAMVLPRMSTSYLPAILGGIAAALGRVPGQYLVNRLVGVEVEMAIKLVAIKSLPAIGFGIVGALLVPEVVRRLRNSGLFPHAQENTDRS